MAKRELRSPVDEGDTGEKESDEAEQMLPAKREKKKERASENEREKGIGRKET